MTRFRVSSLSVSILIALACASATPRAEAQRALGIDVSSYQGGSINWANVKSSGVTFAWAKATEGTYDDDADFVVNENNGKAAGVLMGAYDFCRPDLYAPATEESFFWSYAGSYILADGKTLMPMLDFETFNGVVGASTYSAWANSWCDDVVVNAANVGVTIKPFIYSSACHFYEFDSSISQWYSDIADYNGENPQSGSPWDTGSACTPFEPWGSGVWHTWQYSSTASVSGVSGNCDVDVLNGTYSALTNTYAAVANGSGAVYYWDPQKGSTQNPYTGSMSGTWETASWDGTSVATSSTISWVESKAACFGVNTGTGTPAYTVTMNSGHVVAGFFDGGLSPKACNVTITGAGAILLTSGAQAFDAQNGSDGSSAILTISNSIGGTGQLVPEGNGQSYLNGSNTYTGGTALGYTGVPFSGTVNFNNGSAFGTGTLTLQGLGTGGALVAEGTAAITITNAVTVATGTTNNIVGNAAGLTFAGPWNMGATFDMGTGPSTSLVTIAGPISGTGYLYKTNGGTLALSGTNSYSGSITVLYGTLTMTGSGVIGNGSYSANITNKGIFNYSSSANQTFSGAIWGSGGVFNVTSGALTLSGASDNNTLGANVSGSGKLVLAKTSSTSAHALGSTVGVTSGGTLQLAGSGNDQLFDGITLTIANGGTFDLNGRSEGVNNGVNVLGSGVGGIGVMINNASSTTSYWSNTVSLSSACSLGGAGNLTILGVVSGSGQSLTKIGAGTLTLNAAATYSGATAISTGTLALGASGSINNTPSVSIAAGATLDVSAVATYNSPSAASLTASGAASPATIKGGTTVNLGSSAITLNYDGTDPALTISHGALSLNGNAFTVNGTVLGPGSYVIVQQTTGNITATGTFSVGGTAIPAAGAMASVSVSGGTVVLTITNITTTTLGALSPTTYGQPVTLSATVAPTPPGGTVQFYDNSVAIGAPASLNSGVGSYTTSLLPAGSNQISAAYSGTTGYGGSTSTNSMTQIVTPAPLTITATAQSKVYGTTLNVGPGNTNFITTALQNSETVGSVTLMVSSNGNLASAPVGTYVLTPSLAAGGTFNPNNYAISYANGTLTVTLPSNTIPVTITNIAVQNDGSVLMNFTGTPGYVYMIESTTNLTPPISWNVISTNAADTNGNFSFDDTNAITATALYYQTTTQ